MAELKNLKDMEKLVASKDIPGSVSKDSECPDQDKLCCYRDVYLSTYYLRQELIKYIKFLDIELTNPELGGLKNLQEKQIGICATVEWIKHVFNITERDLRVGLSVFDPKEGDLK